MILSLHNLRAGLHWWSKGNFAKDLLNDEYYRIYEVRSEGATDQWWTATVARLGQWRAYRGPRPPNRKSEISRLGGSCLSAIADQYAKLVARSAAEPNIADLSWEDAVPLFELAMGIKRSPVFAGKMCHFLLPKLFVVMDNLATTVLDYEFYWRGMKEEWARFEPKKEAGIVLAEAISAAGTNRPLHPLYPFETKIMELSHIGYNHPVTTLTSQSKSA